MIGRGCIPSGSRRKKKPPSIKTTQSGQSVRHTCASETNPGLGGRAMHSHQQIRQPRSGLTAVSRKCGPARRRGRPRIATARRTRRCRPKRAGGVAVFARNWLVPRSSIPLPVVRPARRPSLRVHGPVKKPAYWLPFAFCVVVVAFGASAKGPLLELICVPFWIYKSTECGVSSSTET
jgi:hypothetical protein